MKRRPYQQRARASAVSERREDVLKAVLAMVLELPYEAITFQAVAERARVSVKTITRQFGSKDALISAAAKWSATRETSRRTAPPGDLAAIVETLVARYEVMLGSFMKRVVLEERVPAIRKAADRIRRIHLEWLAEAFAHVLPAAPDPRRRERLVALFTATELYSWWSIRHLGFTRKEGTAALLGTLEALVERWSTRRTP